MQFLKTLFWVLLAVIVALFASRNWTDVTLNLWGDIQADIKLPLLLLIAFLLGWLPTWLMMRARIWALPRRSTPWSAIGVAVAADRRRSQPTTPGPVDMNPIFVAIDTPDLDRARRHRARPSASMPAA